MSTSLPTSCGKATQPPTCSGKPTGQTPDEQAALLALSILDHRMAIRDRYEGAERSRFITEAVRQARLALDGARIDELAVGVQS